MSFDETSLGIHSYGRKARNLHWFPPLSREGVGKFPKRECPVRVAIEFSDFNLTVSLCLASGNEDRSPLEWSPGPRWSPQSSPLTPPRNRVEVSCRRKRQLWFALPAYLSAKLRIIRQMRSPPSLSQKS